MGERRILITGARAPVSLHLARLFHTAGLRVELADSPARPLSAASRCVSAYHRLPPPRQDPAAYGRAVRALVERAGITDIVPTCEEVFYLSMTCAGPGNPARLHAPGLGELAAVHNKHDFIALAAKAGLAVPDTTLLQSPADVAALRPKAGALVFKPAWSRFANDVLIRPDARALAGLCPTPAAPWVAQRYIAGEEISAYAIAHQGRIAALALYRSQFRAGRGAGICLEPVQDAAATAFVTRLVAATGWSGQISFDLMRQADGTVLPLECNPRATSGVHFFRAPHEFTAAFFEAAEAVAPDVTTPQTVPLAMWAYGLPAALRRGQPGRFFRALRGADDLLDWPGDRLPRLAQWRALAEIASTALRHRVSLQAASTHDIEWNGQDQSSI